MRIIGLDVGEKRIGVAKADSDTRIAVPVGFVLVDGSEWQEIAKIASLNSTNFFVLGLPRSNEGNETAQTLYVRSFARTLMGKIPGAKVRFQDESLTSVEAETRLKKRKKRYEKGEIDAEAASIILQDFIEGFQVNPNADTLNQGAYDSSEVKAEKITESTKALAKKEVQKVAFGLQKAKHKGKKLRNALIISPILLILALGGVTAVLKYRDHLRQQREEEYAKQEAEMEAATFNFTIRPGETIMDIKKHLSEVDRNTGGKKGERLPNYTVEEIETAFKADYDFDFLKSRPAGASLEGYLFPETHNFYANATVEDILEVFLAEMGKVIAENNLVAKYAEHDLSLNDGIILASIVQRESTPSDVATVAQVLMTRMAYGWTLGADATVTYALDVIDPDRTTHQDNAAALEIDSCYNTRLYAGLPCGPISNPGLPALLAVAEPSDTAYLYFLTGDDGLMYYSSTEYEHTQNVYRYCQILCNISL